MIPKYKPYLERRDFFGSSGSRRVNIDQVEEKFAQKVNSKYALLLPYGRSAYYFLLRGHGITGQEVILPAYTCNVLTGPVKQSQNQPVYVDSSAGGFNMDPLKIAEKITERTKMILFSEIWGEPLSAAAVAPFRNKGILLVGDYSLSLFSYMERGGEILDSLDAAFFSFAPGKEISALGGGMLVTNNPELYEKVKSARDKSCMDPGLSQSLKVRVKMLATMTAFSRPFYKWLMLLSERTAVLNSLKASEAGIKDHIPADFFILPSALQRRMIVNRLDQADEHIAERKRALEFYYDALEKCGLTLFNPYPLASYIAYNCGPQSLQSLQRALFKKNIHSASAYKRSLTQIFESDNKSCVHADRLAQSITMLPLFYGITEQEINRVADALKATLELVETKAM